ncbi:DNA-binding protein [Methylobacter sp.]|uniref:DNA-binding protein n=1 Tax=Methylobacter sp. TaxID=2051955 RepID=UPI002FDE5C46
MASSRLTEEEVHAACIDMAGQGERPTVIKLRGQLGRGSMTTITKYLNSWNDTDQAQAIKAEALPAVVNLPRELATAGEDLVKKVWHAAKAIADAELEIQREALKQAEVINKAKVEEAFKFSEDQEAKIEQIEDALTAMKKDLSSKHLDLTQITDKLNNAEKLNMGLSKDNEHLTLSITDLKLKIADLEKLNAALAERKQSSQEIYDKALKQKDAELFDKNVELAKLSVRYESVALELTEVKVDLEKVSKAAAAAGSLISNLEGQLKVYQSLDNSLVNQS